MVDKLFFAERFPQPVSPLSWSILAKYLERRAFLDPLTYLGVEEFKQGQIFKLISGRPYTNLRAFQLLYQSFPSFLLPEDKKNLLNPQTDKQLPSGDLFNAILKIVRQEDHWRIKRHKREWEQFIKCYSADLKEVEDIDLHQLSWKRLFILVDRLEGLTDSYLSIHRWSITYADIFYHLLKLVCRKMLGDKDNQLATSLITGLEGNLTVEINTALWRISRHLKGNVSEKELESFMKLYGHCSNNLDLSCPRWRENPKYTMNLIRYLSRLDDDQSPSSKEKELRHLREKNTSRAKDLLSASTPAFLPSLSAYLFSKLLDLTQYFIILRENQRFYWQMSLSQLRLVLLALADKLRKKRIITNIDDIFLLTKAELLSVFNGELSTSRTSRLISERREEQRLNKIQHPPALIGPDDQQALAQQEFSQSFRGIGVSPGETHTVATVAPDLKNYRPLPKKTILVTIGLDPGWTPVLGTVAGLIMEVGGYLSHGAIMAREFGIPAVAGISDATKLIKTGKNVRLDGNKGIVEIC